MCYYSWHAALRPFLHRIALALSMRLLASDKTELSMWIGTTQ